MVTSWASHAACSIHVENGTDKNRSIFFQIQRITSLIIVFSFGAAVYTGPGPVKDVFSTTNRMTVLFITDSLLAKGGFKANFTTGYHLGIPGMCTRDDRFHYNFRSKMIQPGSILKPKYDFIVCIQIHSFIFILSEIFFLPLHLYNHCLSWLKAGIHIFSRSTCTSLGCWVLTLAHWRGPF